MKKLFLYVLLIGATPNSIIPMLSNNERKDPIAEEEKSLEKYQEDLIKAFTQTLESRVRMHQLTKIIKSAAPDKFTPVEKEKLARLYALIEFRLDDARKAYENANAVLWGGKDILQIILNTDVHLGYSNQFTNQANELLNTYEKEIKARLPESELTAKLCVLKVVPKL